ncbi:MAG: DNA adenine methylase [Dehalococcoidia bacterium]|jgi:16S rRNA G966 N2-methylase RsmD
MKVQSHAAALDAMKSQGLWQGSFNGKESTLQQLAPYVGKLKSGIASGLIEYFTQQGEWVCDPFSGSGVVPLEALLRGRKAAANDLSIYAYCMTRGKAEAPAEYGDALARAGKLLTHVADHQHNHDLRKVDQWVRAFFHPHTLKETLTAFDYCKQQGDWFLASCLCGILHHQRPGFLSYPSSHLVPYLRTKLFPQIEYPELYSYRALAPRLLSKIKRAYRRPCIEKAWTHEDYDIRMNDAGALPFKRATMDLILTSPPYYQALTYARDNRLRLWFLGEKNWQNLDQRLTARERDYEQQMSECLKEMHRILKPGKYCILIVGEVIRNGKTRDTAEVLGGLAHRSTNGGFSVNCIVEDRIPDIRRSRRGTKTTRIEKILVLQKAARRPRRTF